MIGFFFFGGLLILIGITQALQKEAYYTISCLCVPIKEGKLSDQDAMRSGIITAVIGLILVGTGIFQYLKNKSKPDS